MAPRRAPATITAKNMIQQIQQELEIAIERSYIHSSSNWFPDWLEGHRVNQKGILSPLHQFQQLHHHHQGYSSKVLRGHEPAKRLQYL